MQADIKGKVRDENGAVLIVEASIIFPIMFFVLIFLIYMGNAFFIKASVQSMVESYALQGAKYCADPMLQKIEKKGSITLKELKDVRIQPYRYVNFLDVGGGKKKIEEDIEDAVEKRIKKDSSFFTNMKPDLKKDIATYTNHMFYSTFSVEVEYVIRFPIRLLGENSNRVLRMTARAEAPVNDAAEFIRNVDMVQDYLQGTKAGNTIAKAFTNINKFIKSLADLGGKGKADVIKQ